MDKVGDKWIINKSDDDWVAEVIFSKRFNRLEFKNFRRDVTDISLEYAKSNDNCEKIKEINHGMRQNTY